MDPKTEQTGDIFNMSGEFRGAIINIKSTMQNVQQSVGDLRTDNEAAMIIVLIADGFEQIAKLQAKPGAPRNDAAAEKAAGALDAIGGLGSLVCGAAVTLKPNMVSAQPYPVTTDPVTTFALVAELRKAGCGALTICDSPTQGGARKDEGFSKNGYFEQGRAAGVTVVGIDNATDEEFRPVQRGESQLYRAIRVDSRLFDAPVVINLPTLKRHFAPGMTCGLKNYFGAVHRGERGRAHQEMRSGSSGAAFFKRAIAELAESLRSERGSG